MEARLIRTGLILALALVLAAGPARAACDLDQLVGYQLVFAKTVEGYMEDGRLHPGFEGCTRDRVLVFADRSGLRCQETFIHHAERPKAYLFARSPSDLKLCVDNDLYVMAPAN